MRKPITEERVFCDFCGARSHTQCIVCGKDLCPKHRMELVLYLNYQAESFQASLCPEDAQPLRPFLESLAGKSTSWKKAGQNPEYNEARLLEILTFLTVQRGNLV